MSSLLAAYREFQTRGGLADLSDRVKLRLTGAECVRYLNGQITANVTKAAEETALRACVTTAKGKLCADVFIRAGSLDMIAAGGASILVDAEPELRESLLARLSRYIVADDVVVEDITESAGLVHYLPPLGAGLESLIERFWLPFDPHRANRFGRDGFDFDVSPKFVRNALEELTNVELLRNSFRSALKEALGEEGAHLQQSRGHVLLTAPLLETLRIEAGIPRWGRELGEDTLPPEAGLDRTHIDYHKGCYIGQEVISRLKSVGHVNRQLTGFVSEDGTPPVAGAAIFSPADERPVGVITSVAFSFALEKPIALGYLRRGSPTGGLLARPADPAGAEVRVAACPLPFVPS